VTGLQLASILVDKFKETYAPALAREGALDEVQRLAQTSHEIGMQLEMMWYGVYISEEACQRAQTLWVAGEGGREL
jgi:hypothetical protein